MTISFDGIPSNQRVPLFYAEFSNERAIQGLVDQEYNILLVGNKLTTGTQAELSPATVTSFEQAKSLFGAGSVLSQMVKYCLANNSSSEITCVGIDDLVAGVQAAGAMLFAGTATAAGTISLLIGGENIKVGVAVGDTAADVATAVVAAVTANVDLEVSAAVNGSVAEQADITAKHKGEFGNNIDLRNSYFSGESLPAGITVTTTQMSGGTGNPDMDEVWPVIGDKQYILMSMPYTDAQNLGKVESELNERFGPLKQNDGYAIYGVKGTLGALQTIGNSRNSQFTTLLQALGPHTPWAQSSAAVGKVAAAALIDPARPFQTLVLTDILAASESERFTNEERNILLFDGIATSTVDSGQNVRLEAMITTFKENAFGSPDESYLFLNTPLTLSYLRFTFKARITSKYPRHKLANDGTRFSAGQAVVTPNVAKGEIIALFTQWEEDGLVEGFDQFKNDLIVERNGSNKNRLDVLASPDLINQLRIFATKIAFLL